MQNIFTKISLFTLISVLILACDAVKKVPNGKNLLTKNQILINNKKNNDDEVVAQVVQQPNTSILGFKLRLNMYNLAKDNTDSLYKAKFIKDPKKYYRLSKWLSKKQVDRLGKSFWYYGIHNFLKKTGEPPVIIDSLKAKRSIKRLEAHYFNQGFFDAKGEYKVNYSGNKRGEITYKLETGQPTFLDTISHQIDSPVLDSLYEVTENSSLIKRGDQFNDEKVRQEITRLTTLYRNHGVYHFQPQNILFEIDSTTKKAPVLLKISDRRVKEGDSIIVKPFKAYKISEVNIFTTSVSEKNNKKIADSASYNYFNLYSTSKLKYRPRAITNAVFIQKDSLYSDDNRTLTLRSLNNLRIFNYPNIQYIEDPETNTLKANIFLTAKKKFSFRPSVDVTHSNIQDFGISGNLSLSIRNVFRGAEIFEFGIRGNIGSSTKLANPDNQFFNVLELGADTRLSFPRLFLPFNTEKIIPKKMFPASYISMGFSKQKNIGLDKENFTSVVNYSWTPNKTQNFKLDLINFQYVKNVNTDNYFNVYKSSYNRLNELAKIYNNNPYYLDQYGNLLISEQGADGFMYGALNYEFPNLVVDSDDYNEIKSIQERKDRLTENNLIFASNLTFTKDTKTDIFDKQFYSFRAKIESAGNFMSLVANAMNRPKNVDGSKDIFGLQYSQYIKTEFDFVRHWDLGKGNSIAIRTFFGIAVPYGNSKYIPFSRSYFAGGSNDNRAWQSYSLGPGSSGGRNDFNEANMKIALNTELRFKYFGNLYGALFADCGNIWNVFDNETDNTKKFNGIRSLETLALGTGTGFRYDFKFFIVRLDFGFKTYNPALNAGERWFREINLSQSVLNIGINYPF